MSPSAPLSPERLAALKMQRRDELGRKSVIALRRYVAHNGYGSALNGLRKLDLIEAIIQRDLAAGHLEALVDG